jgi:hypothetical protein
MAKSHTTTHQRKPAKLKTALSPTEIRRIAEKLGVALEHDAESIALLTLLFDQLEQNRTSNEFFNITHAVKTHIFIGTEAADDARSQFEANAYRNRGKLLLWPTERKETA